VERGAKAKVASVIQKAGAVVLPVQVAKRGVTVRSRN